MSNQRNPRSALLTALLAFTLSACGPTVNVKLVTGLESQGRFKNLMNGLVYNPNSVGTCVQKNLYAGVSAGDGPESPLDTFRIPMVTEMDTSLTNANPINALWVSQYSSFPPVVVPVPRGVEVGVGILGAISWSVRRDAVGDTCNDFVAGTGATSPYLTSSVIGHQRIVANSDVEIPLKVWVTPVNVAPLATPSMGDPVCDTAEPGQQCPSQDFLIVSCPGCGGTRHLQFEYAPDRSRPEQRVIQWVPYSTSSANLYVPHHLPLTVNSIRPLDNALMGQYRFTKADLTLSTDGTGSHTATQMIGGNFVTIREPAKRIPPAISGPFAITAIAQQGDNVLLTWTKPSNATIYQVDRMGTFHQSIPDTSPAVVTGLPSISTSGGSHALRIKASNSLGSAPVTTAAATINAVGAFTTAPSQQAGTAGTKTLPISCGAATGGVTYGVVGYYDSGGTGTPPSQISATCSGSPMTAYISASNYPALTSGAVYKIVIKAYGSATGGTPGLRESAPVLMTVY